MFSLFPRKVTHKCERSQFYDLFTFSFASCENKIHRAVGNLNKTSPIYSLNHGLCLLIVGEKLVQLTEVGWSHLQLAAC